MGEALSSGEYSHSLCLYRVLLLENELGRQSEKTMGRFVCSLFVLFSALFRQRVIEQSSSVRVDIGRIRDDWRTPILILPAVESRKMGALVCNSAFGEPPSVQTELRL
jgi:hypothetical protein